MAAADFDEGADPLGSMDLEDEQLLANLGHHPLLERVQAQLLEQLAKRQDRVEEELREQKEDETQLAARREELGVELYGVQQRLAKLQMTLEESTASAEAVAHVRTRAEADLATFREGYAKRREQVAAQEARMEELRSELDGVTDALREARKFAEEQKGQVAVARRETYKAEAEVTGAEKRKAEQDDGIDDLSERVKRLGEKLAVLEAQVGSQRRDAAAAEETLREAAGEAEEIEAEKRQLLGQWRSLLVELGRRDRALEECAKVLREQEQHTLSLGAEENNTARAISKAQDAAAALAEVREREEGVIRFCETSRASLLRQQEALMHRQEMLKASLESADAEDGRLRTSCDALRKQVSDLERDIGLAQKRRQAAESGREADESAQVTARKAARNLAKGTRQLLDLIHKKELDKAETENQLARARVEGIEAATEVDSLRETLSRVEADLRDKEALVAKYELEIRQRHDAIEKKSSVVDRLNRKFDAATRNLPEEEHTGPLQATAHNLAKKIAETRAQVDTLQRRWLGDQSALVEASADAEDKAAQLRELQAQRVLMDQKRLRLERAVAAQRADTADLKASMARMRDDMERISGLIAKNDGLRKRLEESTFAAETDFVEGLKEAESASVAAEADVGRLKEAKARLLEDVLEAERQGAMLEKKLKLEREMQEALDPSVGESEVQAMQREIHRMRLRLDALKRDQERLVKDLQRAVQMREDISVRFRSRMTGKDPKAGGLTKAGAGKRAVVLRKQVKERRAATARLAGALEGARAELDRQEARVAEEEAAIAALEDEVEGVQAGVNAAVYDKQKGVETLATLEDVHEGLLGEAQHAAAVLEAAGSAAAAGLRDEEADAAAAEAMEAAAEHREAIREAVREVQADLPELAEVLERVHALTSLLD